MWKMKISGSDEIGLSEPDNTKTCCCKICKKKKKQLIILHFYDELITFVNSKNTYVKMLALGS